MMRGEVGPLSYKPGKEKNMVRKEIGDGILDHEEDKFGEGEEQEEERIPKELIDVIEFGETVDYERKQEIYDWYEKAMRRRNREPMEEGAFFGHFFGGGSFDKPYMFGGDDKGYLLGYFKNGVFVPSHFAPKSLRSGYELFKELGDSEIKAVLLITEDLAKTLAKMPEWKIEDIEIPAYFRGEIVKKKIAHNDFYGAQEKLAELAEEYMRGY